MTTQRHWLSRKRLFSLLLDGVIVVLLLAFGWYLVGYFHEHEILATGYQDWIYHAYRIKAIQDYGIASWDHIWSNGLNHWKSYQYIPHLITLGVIQLFGVSVTKGMLYTSIGIIISYIFSCYIFLRLLGARRIAAIIAVVASLTVTAYWGILKDYSIAFVLLFFPLYVYLWAKDIQRHKRSYFVPALAGIFWVIHPVMGYSATGLWAISLYPQLSKENLLFIAKRAAIYLVTSSIFVIPYLLRGYNFSNPNLVSTQFLRATLASEYYGLGLLMLILTGVSWIAVFINTKNTPRWARLLLVYACLYLAIMIAGKNGYLPTFLVQLQITRAIPVVAVSLTFVFGIILTALGAVRSRFVQTVYVVILAVVMTLAIESASSGGIILLDRVQNPVATYLSAAPQPTGSVYYDNVSEASYFSPAGTRFVTSYNGHLEPHPLAQRFNLLLKNDVSYTGITKKQSDLVAAYSTVLGVEYLFLPKLSPVIGNITATESAQPRFSVVENQAVLDSGAAILRAVQPIHNAYVVPEGVSISQASLPQPTLNASSWKPWDEEVLHLAGQIAQGQVSPLPMQFTFPDRLSVTLPENRTGDLQILITQSYEQYWRVAEDPSIKIKPTTLRHMILTIPQTFSAPTVTLQHSWPWWHWPLQVGGWLFAGAVLLIETVGPRVRTAIRRFKKEHPRYA